MARVKFTSNLTRFYPGLGPLNLPAGSVAELLQELERRCPGLCAYLVDDTGALREHVNIFIGEDLIRDRIRLSDPLRPDETVYVMQALSGG